MKSSVLTRVLALIMLGLALGSVSAFAQQNDQPDTQTESKAGQEANPRADQDKTLTPVQTHNKAPVKTKTPSALPYTPEEQTSAPPPPAAKGDVSTPVNESNTSKETPLKNPQAVTPITSDVDNQSAGSLGVKPVQIGTYVLPDFVQKMFNTHYFERAARKTPPGYLGFAHEWQTGLQKPATPIKVHMEYFFENWLLIITTGIVVFVAALMVFIFFRFNERANPVPSKRSHNVPLEIIWTLIPVLILTALAFPSFKLLYYGERIRDPQMTIKVTGHQWYWEYQYPDAGNFSFNSTIIPDKELKPDQLRLLEVDNHLVVPANTVIRVQVTAADVLHGFFIPSFGVNKLAVPGRLDELWIKVNAPGMYYGQCSKICGVNHSYMPIAVEALPPEEFKAWLEQAKTKYSSVAPSLHLAQIQ